jgi:hypothetical protein
MSFNLQILCANNRINSDWPFCCAPLPAGYAERYILEGESYMNDWNFNQCRSFLENMIANNIENPEITKELLVTYRTLLEKKSEVDIQFMQSDESVRKEWEKNQTERIKAQVDMSKNNNLIGGY